VITYDWITIRTDAIHRFGGETPGAQVEAEIIRAFEHHPTRVLEAINQIGRAYTQGTVRSGWAVLRAQLARAQPDATAEDTTERENAVRRAEQWIRTAGIHYDRHREITRELYGPNGRLRAWAGDRTTRRRTRDHYREHRAIGTLIELEHEQRMRAIGDRYHEQHANRKRTVPA
jgi:hypothetical protein